MSGNVAPDNIAPCILIDDHAAAKSITQHLIKLGHEKIAFIAGGSEDGSTIERLTGYKEALINNNIDVNEDLIIDGEYTFESGVNGAKTLLNAKEKPSAIFACNDEIAAGALFSSRLMGIEIPGQLSIVGFENSPFSRQTWPTLTTADQPTQSIAEDAANLLIAYARKQKVSEQSKHYTPQLVVRDSTAKVRE